MDLPVPDQLKVQLDKCKTVRGDDYHKSREKTPQVSHLLTAKVDNTWNVNVSLPPPFR